MEFVMMFLCCLHLTLQRNFAYFQGFKYLYLSPDDFKKVSAMNSLQAELIDDEGGCAHYKILTVIGNCLWMLKSVGCTLDIEL